MKHFPQFQYTKLSLWVSCLVSVVIVYSFIVNRILPKLPFFINYCVVNSLRTANLFLLKYLSLKCLNRFHSSVFRAAVLSSVCLSIAKSCKCTAMHSKNLGASMLTTCPY